MSNKGTLKKTLVAFLYKFNTMKWQFNVNHNGNIALNAELICRTHQMEQIKITGKNISFILIGNRPLIEGIQRPHHLPIKWRIFYGEMNDEKLYNNITKQVENYIVQNANNKNVEMFSAVKKTA